MTIQEAISKAEQLESDLPASVISGLKGMSSPRIWHLLNNLVDGAYLEIGVWKGSTLISALYGKNIPATAIDNFSQFGGPKAEFVKTTFEAGVKCRFLDGDCFDNEVIDKVPKGIKYYFYDGAHSERDQYNALVKYINKMADQFVYIVDDWNEKGVQDGTFKAVHDIGLQVVGCHELLTPKNAYKETWWNGIAIFKLKKSVA